MARMSAACGINTVNKRGVWQLWPTPPRLVSVLPPFQRLCRGKTGDDEALQRVMRVRATLRTRGISFTLQPFFGSCVADCPRFATNPTDFNEILRSATRILTPEIKIDLRGTCAYAVQRNTRVRLGAY